MTPINTLPKQAVKNLLPRLLYALDTAQVTVLLNQHWSWVHNRDLRVVGCDIQRVFPRGLESCVVKYGLTLEGDGKQTTQIAFAQILPDNVTNYRGEIIEKLRKSRRKQISRNHDSDVLAAFPESGILLRLPGYDEKLPGLSLAYRQMTARQSLSTYLDLDSWETPPRITSTILNHRLNKRCVLRMQCADKDDRKNSVVVRCLKDKDQRHRANLRDMQALWALGFDDQAEDRICIPRALGVDDERVSIILEDMPGEMLGETENWPQTMQAALAGKAIAKLHNCSLQVNKRYTWIQEMEMLDDWVEFTSLLRPELAQSLCQVNQRLHQRFGQLPAIEPQLTHRDFYGKQLLYNGERTVLIDFDTLSLADQAIDLANHLAHRRLAELTNAPADPAEYNAFLDAYAEQRKLPSSESIQTWYDAALLRLACLYAMRTGWEHLAPELLKEMA